MGWVFDVLPAVPRAAVERDLFGPEKDGDPIVVGTHDDGLRNEAPGYGVGVAIEANSVRFGDTGRLDLVGVEGGGIERFEQRSLLVLVDEQRDFFR
jgi:hypothetical protein